MKKGNFFLFCILALTGAMPLQAQVTVWTPGQQDERIAHIGLRLDEVFRRFGAPLMVRTARGSKDWQDDVVFMYSEENFYIYRNRVWQIGLKSIFGMKVGDSRAVALLVLGEGALDRGDYFLCSLPGAAWPLSLRVNVRDGKISAIYIYRPDY